MSKRIFMIAPHEVLTGNLSGKQNLVYPANNNKAYDAPEGVQYAKNYRTSYIGCRRAKDGRVYFQVKRASAVKISTSSKLNMALLGATQSIIAELKKDSAFMVKMGASLVAAKAQGFVEDSTTIEKYMRDMIRTALASKVQYVAWTQSAAGTPVCTNPFVYVSGAGANVKVVQLSAKILREFWGALATSPIEFRINGALKGIAHAGNTFGAVTNGKFNVLGLKGQAQYVSLGDAWQEGGLTYFNAIGKDVEGVWTAVSDSDTLENGVAYFTEVKSL